jgi:hypothetical protein
MFNFWDVMIFLGFALGIEAISVSAIAFVISKVFGVRLQKVVGAGAIALLLCGAISGFGGWEGTAVLTLSGASVCGCLLALGWLINLIKGDLTNRVDWRKSF